MDNVAVKTSFSVFFLVLVLMIGSKSSAQQTDSTQPLEGDLSVIVNIEGLQCCEGTLRIALYNDKTHWMGKKGMVRGRIGMVISHSQRVEIHGLPSGTYAIAAFQDINGDGKLNRRFGLIPKEPYGFSNNVGKYGPASFEKASFNLVSDQEISFSLHRAGRKKASEENKEN